MHEMQTNQISLSDDEKNRIKGIFTDPVKVLILLKILRIPGISSRELKDEVNMKGTKIYYYLSDFEGVHPKTKESLHEPLVRVESEETQNHLIMKRYYPSDYLNKLVSSHAFFDLHEDPRENFKWNYMTGVTIGVALLQSHLRDVEKKPLKDFEEESPFREMISYNEVTFVKKEVYEKHRDQMKQLIDSICQANENESLIDSMNEATHAFIMGATTW